MGENDFIDGIENNKYYKQVEEIAKEEGAETLPICAEMEAEIAQLDDEEKLCSLQIWGLKKADLTGLLKKLLTFRLDFVSHCRQTGGKSMDN